jgi:hypothetical protein
VRSTRTSVQFVQPANWILRTTTVIAYVSLRTRFKQRPDHAGLECAQSGKGVQAKRSLLTFLSGAAHAAERCELSRHGAQLHGRRDVRVIGVLNGSSSEPKQDLLRRQRSACPWNARLCAPLARACEEADRVTDLENE